MGVSDILVAVLQQYPGTASAVTIVSIVGFVLVHIMPLLPVPAQGATGWWAKVYPTLAFVVGSWGSQVTPRPPAPGAKP